MLFPQDIPEAHAGLMSTGVEKVTFPRALSRVFPGHILGGAKRRSSFFPKKDPGGAKLQREFFPQESPQAARIAGVLFSGPEPSVARSAEGFFPQENSSGFVQRRSIFSPGYR